MPLLQTAELACGVVYREHLGSARDHDVYDSILPVNQLSDGIVTNFRHDTPRPAYGKSVKPAAVSNAPAINSGAKSGATSL